MRILSTMTIWKAVAGFEGLYRVSDEGQVDTRNRRGEWSPRAIHTDRNGYKRVTLSREGVKTNHLVHHLVLEAFVGPRPGGTECRHLNGQPGDSRLVNLQWGTPSENAYDKVRHGTHHAAAKTHCKRGHEFTPENTIRNGPTGRGCRTCNNERAAAWYEKNKRTGLPQNAAKTHCKRGHEFTPENTYSRKDGGRQCKTCIHEASMARYQVRKAAKM